MAIETGRKKTIRVLAWPKHSEASSYFGIIYDRLPPDSVVADQFSTGRALARSYDIFHFHFPERVFYFNSFRKAAIRILWVGSVIAWVKLRGTKLVWTVHNLRSHEQPRSSWIDKLYYGFFTRAVDCYICMNPSTRTPLLERYPALAGKPFRLIPHPHYRGVYPNGVGRNEARDELGLERDARVVLFVGQMRAYKNVPKLIAAFRQIEGEDLRLVVAGLPVKSDEQARIEAAAEGDSRIRLHLAFVPDDRLQHFLNAADLVALPYRDILNSGSAILALSFDRPVLVPRRGAMGDLAGMVGEEWIRLFDGDLTPAELEAAIAWACSRNDRSPPDLAPLEPEAIAREHAQLYRSLVTGR